MVNTTFKCCCGNEETNFSIMYVYKNVHLRLRYIYKKTLGASYMKGICYQKFN